jgi:hypothetical protein
VVSLLFGQVASQVKRSVGRPQPASPEMAAGYPARVGRVA